MRSRELIRDQPGVILQKPKQLETFIQYISYEKKLLLQFSPAFLIGVDTATGYGPVIQTLANKFIFFSGTPSHNPPASVAERCCRQYLVVRPSYHQLLC